MKKTITLLVLLISYFISFGQNRLIPFAATRSVDTSYTAGNLSVNGKLKFLSYSPTNASDTFTLSVDKNGNIRSTTYVKAIPDSVIGYTGAYMYKYGADVSGTIDATAAVQNAINSSKGVVVFPEGTFVLNYVVQLLANKTIQGAGRGKTIIKIVGNHPAFANTVTNAAILNVTIQDLDIQMDPTTSVAVDFSRIGMSQINRVNIYANGSQGIGIKCSDGQIYSSYYNTFYDVLISGVKIPATIGTGLKSGFLFEKSANSCRVIACRTNYVDTAVNINSVDFTNNISVLSCAFEQFVVGVKLGVAGIVSGCRFENAGAPSGSSILQIDNARSSGLFGNLHTNIGSSYNNVNGQWVNRSDFGNASSRYLNVDSGMLGTLNMRLYPLLNINFMTMRYAPTAPAQATDAAKIAYADGVNWQPFDSMQGPMYYDTTRLTWRPSFNPLLSGPPTTVAAHPRGEIVLNKNATLNGTVGWICTSAGYPGTWQPFGIIGQTTAVTSIDGSTGAINNKMIYHNGNSLGANMIIGTNDGFRFNIFTNGQNRFIIDTAGNVGVGSTLPTNLLHVHNSNGLAGTPTVYIQGADPSIKLQAERAASSGTAFSFGDAYLKNTTSNQTLHVGQIGILGNTGSTNPTLSYLYIGAGRNVTFSVNAIRVDSNQKVYLSGITSASTTGTDSILVKSTNGEIKTITPLLETPQIISSGDVTVTTSYKYYFYNGSTAANINLPAPSTTTNNSFYISNFGGGALTFNFAISLDGTTTLTSLSQTTPNNTIHLKSNGTSYYRVSN